MTNDNNSSCKPQSNAMIGGIVGMLIVVILVGMGERVTERFLPLYMLALGGGPWAIGTLNAFTNLLGALYSYPGGYVSDRLGYRRALLLFVALAIGGYTIVIFAKAWWVVLIGALFFLSWSAVSLPAVMSLVADLMPKKKALGVALHSMVRRIPMAIGPVVGGYLIEKNGIVDGIHLGMGVAIFMAVVASVLILRLIVNKAGKAAAPLLFTSLLSPKLRCLLISDVLVRFAEQIPYAFVVVWVTKDLGFSADTFGWLTALEMLTAFLIYLPVAWASDKSTKKPYVVTTFVFFSIFPLALYFSHTLPMLVVAFIIRGLKEFGEPTRKALILDLAPADARASTFGAYYLIRDTIVSLAAFLGAWLWIVSPVVNLTVATICGAAGTLYFAIYGKDLGSVKS